MARHARGFWEQLVVELDRGAAVAATARRHSVKASTLRWWRSQLRRERRPAPKLLPVVVREAVPVTSARPVEILVGGVVVRVEVGVDVEYVAALVHAVGDRC